MLKDIVAEQVDKYDAQTQEQKNEAINKLQKEEDIVNNIPISKVLKNAEKFPGIEFGNNYVSENIYDIFHIPNKEVIVACIKGKIKNFGSVVDKVILTNKAVYVLPELVDNMNLASEIDAKTNCYYIKDLCKYIIFSTKSYNSIQFLGPYGTEIVLKKPRITAALSQNIIEESFCNLISFIQKEVYEFSEDAHRDREEVYYWLSKKAIEEVLDGNIVEQTKSLIYCLKQERDFTNRCILLLMKQFAMMLKEKELLQVVSEEKQNIPVSSKSDFLEQFEKELELFWGQVTDIDYEFKERYLSNLDIKEDFLINLVNVQPVECEDLEQAVAIIYRKYKQRFELYLGLRKYCNIEESKIRDSLKEMNVADNDLKNVLRFFFMKRNKNMQKVYNSLKNNTSLNSKFLPYVDSCGLTPLHYGLIIGNDEKSQYLIENMSKLTQFYENLDEELLNRYDYGTLCAYLNKEDLLQPILLKSPDIIALQAVKTKLTVTLKAKNVELNFLTKGIEGAERKYREAQKSKGYIDEQIEQYLEKLQEAKEQRRDIREEISNIEREIRAVDHEIQDMIAFLKSKYFEIAKKIKMKETVVDRLFDSLYGSSEMIEKLFYTQDNNYEFEFIHERLFFVCKDIYDEIHSGIEMDLDEDFAETEEDDTDEYFEKPYENSWFSKQAHRDLKILMKEYRELAKQYHPDVNPKYEKVFTEINVERAEILENMK